MKTYYLLQKEPKPFGTGKWEINSQGIERYVLEDKKAELEYTFSPYIKYKITNLLSLQD